MSYAALLKIYQKSDLEVFLKNTSRPENFSCDTNFITVIFEINEADDFRKLGLSKGKLRDPIVQMGLAMDADGIPLH